MEYKVIKQYLSDGDYKLAKTLLYNIRTEKGLKEYQFFKKILYVGAHMAGIGGYASFSSVLACIWVWIGADRPMLEYASFDIRHRSNGHYFGVNVSTIIEGTWTELVEETTELRHKMINSKIMIH